MHCDAWADSRCRSCTRIQQPYQQQLAEKAEHARLMLDGLGDPVWLPAVTSREAGFRNKAKLVVGGNVQAPTLGILDQGGQGVDLDDCRLYPPELAAAFPALRQFIQDARIVPYDVPARRGELKFLLLTLAEHSGDLMLRFVLRSQESLARIRKHLPELQAKLPRLRVISANLQPEHKAVLEGEQEILLGAEDSLSMQLNQMPIHLRPRSFFQTNTEVAAALYRQVRDWVVQVDPAALWDLFCGVGGFALHCADGHREVTGIELSEDAIASARRSRDELGLDRLHFHAMDATAFAHSGTQWPPLVIVNPPRRGLGNALCHALRDSPVQWIAYSSCNAASLARDIAQLEHFQPRQVRLFDMFPHTDHYELACLLQRREQASPSPSF